MALPPSRHRPRRLLRIVLFTIAALVILGIAGIAAFVATFDPNSYKPQIVAAVQSATGRELTLNGGIGLSLSLQPTLEVSDVSFSNPPGFSRPQMATLQRLQVQLALLPLLSRQVRIERLVLVRPDILLETDAQGRSNWAFAPQAGAAPPAAQPSGAASAPAAPPSIALSSLRIEDGTLAMRDATGRTTTLGLSRLVATAASPDAPLHLTADATYNGAALNLTADTGPLSRLEDTGASTPWPVKLAVDAAGAKLSLDGTLTQPALGRGIAMGITADVPDLAALAPLAGTALPALKNIALALKLADSDGGNAITASDFKLTLPQLDLAGTASFKRGTPPLVTADLSAKQIDLDALSAVLSGGAPTAAGTRAASEPTAKSGPRSGYVIPDTKLPLDQIRMLDADLKGTVGDLKTSGVDYKAVKLHAVAQRGQLTLDPLGLDAPGGHIDAKMTVAANSTPPAVTLTLRAPALALQPLLKALNKPGYASGNLELRADLHGAGDTPHAIAASLDGSVGIAVAKGEIDSQLLGGLMAGLLQKANLTQLASKSGMSALNCFAVRLDASHGVGTLKALRLDSSTLTMDGSGGMNFGTETLDLRLRPAAGVAGTNVTVPVKVLGSFAAPSVEPDVVGAVTSNVGTAAKMALGGSTGGVGLIIGSAIEQKLSGDPCAGPLALARFAQPPAAPQQGAGTPAPAAQPKSSPGGAAGALKKLFQ
jgi:uncharacterized protein involved in outer membrane biogenesis